MKKIPTESGAGQGTPTQGQGKSAGRPYHAVVTGLGVLLTLALIHPTTSKAEMIPISQVRNGYVTCPRTSGRARIQISVHPDSNASTPSTTPCHTLPS